MNNLVGQRFGKLCVVERHGSSKDHRATWLCKCDCGKTIISVGHTLTSGKQTSCGCGKHNKCHDLSGKTFGRLLILPKYETRYTQSGHSQLYWLCKCSCGNEGWKSSRTLLKGKALSCGCLQRELLGNRVRKHGLRNTRLYKIWAGMKARCYNPNSVEYHRYGGRGISICEEWKNDFSKFYDWAMSNDYQDTLTIDRINNDGNYEPSNCQWITKSENSTKGNIDRWSRYKAIKKGD